MLDKSSLLFLLIFQFHYFFGQEKVVSGKITNQDNAPIALVNVGIEDLQIGTSSDSSGIFEFRLSANLTGSRSQIILKFSHIQYAAITREVIFNQQTTGLHIVMAEKIKVLEQVEIEGDRMQDMREKVSVFTIEPKDIKTLPTPFGDFNSVLKMLPGVSGNNELSSTYSVRGGSYDENLVYVNDIPIYRPFLVSAGRQEGLSFINTDMVERVEFSAGGWQAKYGDKLSSKLNITYKTPREFATSATVGFLGGSFNIEGASRDKRFNFVAGLRHKNARLLFDNFDTKGEYLPKFTDIQSYIEFIPSKSSNPKTRIGLLNSFARNRYLIVPKNRETEFGAFGVGVLRLFVAFEGVEMLDYDTYQNGIKITHRFNNKFESNLIGSSLVTFERENSDVEGGYRLCDVDNNPGSSAFNQCAFTRGIGTNYNFARNKLEAKVINIINRNKLIWYSDNTLEFGGGYSRQNIKDQLTEFAFIDSSDFIRITKTIQAENELESNQYSGYIQNTSWFKEGTSLTLGVRFNYWDLNNDFIISPRAQYSFKPNWSRDVILKAALGMYRQQPFYRELRDFTGNVNKDLKAQSSLHAILGIDYNFKLWDRDFKFIAESYYKYLYNIIPYDVDNVRLRYYAENNTEAYATGLDLRVSGEFIQGTESWFSLGLLSTKEDVENDGNGFISRPTDQRINLGIVFQDHIPQDPTIRVNLGLFFGSGLPFGPPGDITNRNVFSGEEYRRVDIGFTKVFNLPGSRNNSIKSLWIGFDILNLLGARNAISYIWVSDVSNRQYAVPNTLSARFFNLKLYMKV